LAISTLSALRTAAQQEADKENDPSVTTAEWNRRVNEGYRALWSIVRSGDPDFFVDRGTATISTVANNFFALAGNRRVRQLWFVTGSTPDDYVRLRRWNLEEPAWERVYKVVRNSVYVYPASVAPGSYILWSEPAFVELVADGDVVDAALIDWTEYVYLYAAFGGRDKEESDGSGLVARMQRLEKEIRDLTRERDIGEPGRVVDHGWTYDNSFRPPRLPDP
jgi:hypothetical protein